MMEDKYEVVTACVDMWNSISEQKIREQVPQTAHYLLQMVSANDNELDGVIRAYEWPEIRDWQPKAHF
jgi:RecA-family ATPase